DFRTGHIAWFAMRSIQDDGATRHRHRSPHVSRSRLVDVGIWIVALLATAATLWFSLGPTAPDEGVDKGLHRTAFFFDTLAILLVLVWRPGRDKRSFDAALWVALAILVAGGLIELLQGGFVHRDAQFADWVADAVGVGLAVLVFAVARRTLGGARPS